MYILLRIVNVSVIVLYNVVYDFRVLEMHVDACVSIHSRFHVCVFYACHAYSVCACGGIWMGQYLRLVYKWVVILSILLV